MTAAVITGVSGGDAAIAFLILVAVALVAGLFVHTGRWDRLIDWTPGSAPDSTPADRKRRSPVSLTEWRRACADSLRRSHERRGLR